MSNTELFIANAVKNLPPHYRDAFSDDFLKLIACLRLHGFSIQRADEALPPPEAKRDLWTALSHPSIWLYNPEAPTAELRAAEPGSPEHQHLINIAIQKNLTEQKRLIDLLAKFYTAHTPATFQAGLIVETIDLGETCLRPQGASVRLILDDQNQREWLHASQHELNTFADFLASKL